MLRPTLRFLLVLSLAALIGLASVHAANNNIAVLRVESLDNVIDDAQRVATLLGYPIEKEHIVEMLSQSSGISNLSWVDTTAPLAIVFPLEGMTMGEKGLTALFPASDANAAFEAIAAGFATENVGDDGVRAYGPEEGDASLFVAMRDGYLVAGASRDIVTRIDLEAALQMAVLPPGSIALDFYLEPIAPMAMMGLPAARQAVEQRMQQSAEDRPEEAEQEWDPDTALAFVDIYFDFVRDLLTNTSRLQISIEVGSETLIFHKRAIPKDGSTFAGLVAAQQGGLPEAVRFLDPEDQFASFAGQVTITPEFAEALNAYLHAYANVMSQLPMEVASGMGFGESYQQFMKMFTEMSDDWMDCYRGDFAGTFRLHAEGGFQARQLVGVADEEKCKSLMTEMVRMASELPKPAEGEPVLTLTEEAFHESGVQGWRQEMTFAIPEDAAGEEGLAAFWDMWFGEGGGFLSYSALAGDYLLTATGPSSRDDVTALVDSVTAKKKKKAKMVGLSAETFAPVATGPGFFGAFDLKKIFDAIIEHLPVDDEDDQAILDVLRNAPETAGQIVEAARFESDALHVEIAVRLELFEVIGQMVALSGAHDEGQEHEEGHEHGEGEDHDAGHDEHVGHDHGG